MRVSGSATLHAPVERVYQALNDPAVLVRTIPGCERLERAGEDAYKMTVTAGVASVRGTYAGDVRIADQRPPHGFTLKASGAGAPGTVAADVQVRLESGDDGTTVLSYDADAVVGGMIGGVGQRMLVGVAKRTAGEFFAAVDGVLTGAAPAEAPVPAAEATPAGQPAPAGAAAPQVFTAPPRRPAAAPGGQLAAGVALGAAAALLGVLVGGWVARRAAARRPS
jgi:carbon monoxide dehydrogenase subunit G